jgi:hypothetical protein
MIAARVARAVPPGESLTAPQSTPMVTHPRLWCRAAKPIAGLRLDEGDEFATTADWLDFAKSRRSAFP